MGLSEADREQILETARTLQKEYDSARNRRREFVKTIMALPRGQRPTADELAEAMGLKRQTIYQIKDSKDS